MKIKDIKAGKKYYQSFASETKIDRAIGKRERELKIIRVLQVDEVNGKVLASLNGMPAEWFRAYHYKRWQETNPFEEIKVA